VTLSRLLDRPHTQYATPETRLMCSLATMFNLIRSLDSDSPRPYFARSRTVASLSPQLAHILARFPPPSEGCKIQAHVAHGAAIEPRSDSCFAQRMPHVVLGVRGGAMVADPHGSAAQRWVDDVVRAIDEAGLALRPGYPPYMRPDECDAEAVFGVEALAWLRAVKSRCDERNVLSSGHPWLL